MYENKSIFETLFEINVNDHIEKKKDLTYLSWLYGNVYDTETAANTALTGFFVQKEGE